MADPIKTQQTVEKQGYHHGNLREALLAAALEVVREQGVDGLSLRAVARRAGVSHAAPQHHFADKAGLVEALAVEGFAMFTAALQDAWEVGKAVSPWGLASVGFAYVRFAQTESNLFRLMLRPELRGGGGWGTPVGQAALRAYRVLEGAIRACQREGLIEPGDPTPWAMLAWSGVHGLSVLILDGLLEQPVETVDQGQEVTDMVLTAMGMGLFKRESGAEPVTEPRR